MLFGIGLFLLGSILCGFAWSMPALIAFRAVQGLGAGAVQPMAITIAGDIYTVAERAKAQGYLASVWAVSSVVGPTLGGVFSEFLSWRWIFFVNIPLCLLAGVDAHPQLPRDRRAPDAPRRLRRRSAAHRSASPCSSSAVLEGGQAWAWDSLQSIGAFVAGRRAARRFRCSSSGVPPSRSCRCGSSRRRLLLTTTLVALGVGAVLDRAHLLRADLSWRALSA